MWRWGIISYQSAVVWVVVLYLAGWWGDVSCHIGEKSANKLVFLGFYLWWIRFLWRFYFDLLLFLLSLLLFSEKKGASYVWVCEEIRNYEYEGGLFFFQIISSPPLFECIGCFVSAASMHVSAPSISTGNKFLPVHSFFSLQRYNNFYTYANKIAHEERF